MHGRTLSVSYSTNNTLHFRQPFARENDLPQGSHAIPNRSQCDCLMILQNVTGIATTYDSSKTSADPVAGIHAHSPYNNQQPQIESMVTRQACGPDVPFA